MNIKKRLKYLLISTPLFFSAIISVNGQNIPADTNRVIKTENQHPSFLKFKIHYPELAEKNKIEGTIIVFFNIDSTCSIINKRIEKKLGYGCDEEALKLIDQYEIQLKQLNNSICIPQKDLRVPVNFKLK